MEKEIKNNSGYLRKKEEMDNYLNYVEVFIFIIIL